MIEYILVTLKFKQYYLELKIFRKEIHFAIGFLCQETQNDSAVNKELRENTLIHISGNNCSKYVHTSLLT